MTFPAGMKRGTRPPKELVAKVDREIEKAFAKNPDITGKALHERLHKVGLKIGYAPVMKRLKKLRALSHEGANSSAGNGASPPHSEEVEELETSLSHTPLNNGKVRVVLSADLSPEHAGVMVQVVGQVLSIAARAALATNGHSPATQPPTGVALL